MTNSWVTLEKLLQRIDTKNLSQSDSLKIEEWALSDPERIPDVAASIRMPLRYKDFSATSLRILRNAS